MNITLNWIWNLKKYQKTQKIAQKRKIGPNTIKMVKIAQSMTNGSTLSKSLKTFKNGPKLSTCSRFQTDFNFRKWQKGAKNFPKKFLKWSTNANHHGSYDKLSLHDLYSWPNNATSEISNTSSTCRARISRNSQSSGRGSEGCWKS